MSAKAQALGSNGGTRVSRVHFLLVSLKHKSGNLKLRKRKK